MLPGRKDLLGGVANHLALFLRPPLFRTAAIRQQLHGIQMFSGALPAFFDRVDGPNQLAALLAFGLQDLIPRLRPYALQQPAKNLLRAIVPRIRMQPGVPPARRAIPANVRDGPAADQSF